MLTLLGGSSRFCDGVSRRSFLTVGALTFGGLTLADVYRAEAAGPKSPKSIINLYLPGGPSHIDTFDPKPAAPKEFRGEFKAIDTNVAGIQICEHLPQLARRMDRMAIIRSIDGLRDEHDSNQTETGWDMNSLRSIGGRPSIGSVVSKLHGSENGTAPTYVDLSGAGKHGFLGPVYRGFRPDGEGRANLSLGNLSRERLSDRQSLLGGLDKLRREVDQSGMMEAMDSFTQRAVNVVTSGTLANALDVSKEDPRLRARYNQGMNGQFYISDPFLMARRLVEAGVRIVSLSFGGWDTHGDNFNQLRRQLPQLDTALGTLIEDLDARGMLADTTVLVWGEFGRTPRVNSGAGRDHWPRAASLLMAGGGFQMGQVIGSTNSRGEVPKDRPIHIHEIFATLYANLGIDPRYTTLTDPNGRPQYLVEHPTPIQELTA